MKSDEMRKMLTFGIATAIFVGRSTTGAPAVKDGMLFKIAGEFVAEAEKHGLIDLKELDQ